MRRVYLDMHFIPDLSNIGKLPVIILISLTAVGLAITLPISSVQRASLFYIKDHLVAAQKTNNPNSSPNQTSVSGIVYNSSNNGTGALSKQRTVQLSHTIRNLLNQTLDAYKKQNYTHASDLATSAYLDNFEFLEPALLKVDKILKQNTEFMMRSDLRSEIRQHVPLSNVEKLLTQINTNLDKAQKLLS